MVTPQSPGSVQSHYVRPCKKHGLQHGWLQLGEQFFCPFCLGEFLGKHLSQLGPAEICSETSPMS